MIYLGKLAGTYGVYLQSEVMWESYEEYLYSFDFEQT